MQLDELAKKYGTNDLAKMLGYRQGSYISQMTTLKKVESDDPDAKPIYRAVRPVTEKSARRYEAVLGLPEGFLDKPLNPVPLYTEVKPVAHEAVDMDVITALIRELGMICANEKIDLGPAKFADLAALALLDASEHGGKMRTEHVTSLVRLLK